MKVLKAAVALVPLVITAIAGCEALTGGGDPPPPPPDPAWVLSRPFPNIRSLNDVEVVAFDEERITVAYAVGTDGAVLRYDGAGWTDETVTLDEDLESVSAHVDGEGVETVLAVGSNGTILQRIEGRWGILPSPTTEQLFGVWVRTGDDAFIVGDRGTVLRFDGVEVVALVDELLVDGGFNDINNDGVQDPGEDDVVFSISDPLKGVMGRGEDDVYAVGPRGVVYHYDGNIFSREDSQTNRPLADVFTESGIWAAATDGVLLRRRDDGWKDNQFVTPSPVFIQGIWARGDGDVFAVGFSEEIFHNEDGLWNITFVEEQSEMRAIDGAELPRPEDAAEDFVTLREVIAVGAGGRIVRGPLVLPNSGETILDTRPAEIPEEEE